MILVKHIFFDESKLIIEIYIFQLPIKIDIIKHVQEIDGKSTAIHAAIVAPEDIRIYTYPDFPEFSDSDRVRFHYFHNLLFNLVLKTV